MARDRSLYTNPPIKAFTQGDEAELEAFLNKMERDTSVHPFTDVEELQLTDDGTTKRGGFRYTTYGFKQLTQILCPGLSSMLPDLSGTARRRTLKERHYFPREAQRMFNQMLELRGDILSQYRILRNEDEKLIEGLMGMKYRALENLDSYQQMRDAVHSMSSARFYAGLLLGRRLLLWYRNPQPMFVLEDNGIPSPFYSGYYFSNGEATGNSVRGTFAMYTKHGTCLRAFKRDERVTHIGRGFNRRVNKMFKLVLGEEIPVDKLRTGLTELMCTPLGFANLDKKEHAELSKRIRRALGNIGMPQRIADFVIEEALYVGSNVAAGPVPAYELSSAIASRTLYDLFASLLRVARKLTVTRREKSEQAAYQMSLGKLEL